jgi:tyrosine-protein kinase Etk/Wzc
MAFNRPSFNNTVYPADRSTQTAARMSPLDLFENVFDYKYAFIGVFLVCLLGSLAYAIVASPAYSADALIQIEERKASALGSLSDVSKALDIQDSTVLGEMDIVRSRTVLTQAMDATVAQADVSVKNHVPVIGGFLGSILGKEPDGLVAPLLDKPFWAWGGEHVEFAAFDVPDAQLGKKLQFDYVEAGHWSLKDREGRELMTGVVGTPGSANGFTVNVRKITARPGTEFVVQRYATQARLEQIQKKFSVTETKRQSGIIQLAYEDADPVFASRFVNAIATAYLETNARRRAADSERSLAFLNAQLPVVKARVQTAEQALNDYRNKQGTIDVQGEAKMLLDESALVEKSRLEAKLSYEDLLQKFGQGQPQLVAASNKFKQLDQQSAMLQGRIARLPGVQQEYLRLARDVEVNNQLYVGLLNNAQQLQIAQAGTVGNASLIDSAVVPDKPVRPKRAIILLLGAAIGMVLGFVATQAIPLFSGRIRDPKRLEAMVGIQTLGVLPTSPQQIEAGVMNIPRFMITKEETDTPLVEAMDTLAHSLQYKLASTQGSKVVLVTSAVPGQGKSMISANLAYLYAEKGLKTLLIDADMRKSTMHRYLPVNGSKGLSAVLQGTVKPRDAITQAFDNLYALPAGRHVKHVRNLLGPDKLTALVESLRGTYDMIVIDSPPVLPMADAAALSQVADVTLFVARQGRVSYSEVVESISRLGKVGTQVDGLVFNGFEPSPLRYGYYSDAYRYLSEP